MRNPHGYATVIGVPIEGAGSELNGVQEFDTMTCVHSHCFGSVNMTRSSATGKLEAMVFRNDGTFYMKECGFCRTCMQPICPKCDGKPCSNRFAKLDKDELQAYTTGQRLICS